MKGERKPVHMVRSTGKTRVFIFNYRPLGKAFHMATRKAVWFISGIETLKALGTVPKDYKTPACEVIDLSMEDNSLGSASTNIGFEVSLVPPAQRNG